MASVLLGDVVERNGLLYPAREAVVDERRRLTFAELADRAKRLANALVARGLRRGDRVAVISPNCHEMVEAFSASEICGFVTVPLNIRMTGQEVAGVLADCTPAALVFERDYRSLVDRLRPQLAWVKSYLSVGARVDWADEYEAVLATAGTTRPPLRPDPDDTAFIIYTSGSTGRPKGVMHGHRGQIYAALSMSLDGNVDQTDRMIIPNPMYHAGGRWMQMTYHLRGCAIFLQREFDPATLLETIERERITAALLPATMLRAVLDHPDFGRRDWSSLKTIYYASSPTPEPLLRRALKTFGPILVQYYGGTEGGGIGTTMLKHHHVADGDPRLQRRLTSAGQAKPLASVRIVRADGTDCDAGEAGEIIISSPGVMQGYWNNPQATAETLKNGWLYTGDIGTRDEEHFIYIVGRKREMIVSGGANIYPREVEDALNSHPAVRESAVIGVPDEKWGETVHAVVSRRPGYDLTPEELIEHCRKMVASYKKPTAVTFMESLPKLESGKIDKRALREPFWAGRNRQVN
jgi:acyl-CoA synthetase (AMP-forming)/AMP-acid ligase II